MAIELTQEQAQALRTIARDLEVPVDWLNQLIAFESGWNPQAKNPRSSARGLLQWIDATAQDMGYENSADLVARHPTIIEQLTGPVREYFAMREQQHGPLTRKQDLYMAVFYPAAIGEPANFQFPEYVTDVNPGIETPGDYVAMVEKMELRGEFARAKLPISIIGVLAAGAIAVYLLNQS